MSSDDTPKLPQDATVLPSMRVIEAVAARHGVDPIELDVLLADVINPEALDELFVSGNGTLTFEYLGYSVTVHGSGQIDVTDRSEPRS